MHNRQVENRRKSLALLAIGAIAWGFPGQYASAQIAVRNQGYIPFSDPPINYRSSELSDPVAKLQQELERGQATLVYEPEHGYLRAVLQLLQIPINSQTLVFSKTSFQYPKIAPEHPRALYFNDEVYVGSVHDGKAIEIVAFDPMQGAIFYLLDERKAEHPAFERAELDCTQCHIASGTRGIPGVLLRSVYPTDTGTVAPGARTHITDQESPLSERWGGWYVTGELAGAAHMGNAVVPHDRAVGPPGMAGGPVTSAAEAPPASTPGMAKLTPLTQSFDPKLYLSPQSDVVAHLVLAHQTQMHNLITLTNYKTRLALYSQVDHSTNATPAPTDTPLPEATRSQFERPAEQLLRYMLFSNEAHLPATAAAHVGATSTFARDFPSRGPRDSHGRSLRDLDLNTRLFRYPCSYLLYSESFDALPEPAKGYVYHRLLEVLDGKDQSADFAHLAASDRRAILEILLATKRGLPQEWHDYAALNHVRLARGNATADHPDANVLQTSIQ